MNDWIIHDGSTEPPVTGMVHVDLGRGQHRRGNAATFHWGWKVGDLPRFGEIHRYRAIQDTAHD